MLSAEGCRQRRLRLWERLDPSLENDYLLLGDPTHLMYLANFWVDPISLGAGFPGYLLVRRDGHAKLLHDDRLPPSVKEAHVDERRAVPWYNGTGPARGPRQLAVLQSVNPARDGLRIHDRPGDPLAAVIISTIAQMRRQKDPDEVALMRRCMAVTDVGHAWARNNVRAGMTELDVYTGIQSASVRATGMPIIVYGDFIVCDGLQRRVGPPTNRILKNGDMLILDFSVVIGGYRSDFTNTLVIGGNPTPQQQLYFRIAQECMTLGEQKVRAGATCLEIYEASVEPLKREGLYEYFPSHMGHGLGLSHPEPPYIVREADETLRAGDVITLEPGVYPPGTGLRIEHNYLVTEGGFERLSNHVIALG